MSRKYDDEVLPYGWIKQFHDGYPFYVDANAEPPRSIWVHPYEDDQYLNEHPEVREKLAQRKGGRNPSPGASSSPTGSPLLSGSEKHRGFFGKLKDKAIGTKAEREAERERKLELEEQRRQQNMEMQQRRMYESQQAAYAQQQYAQQSPYYEQQQMYAQPTYGNTSARRHGMGGTALPLLGGMVGGLLLADVLDGGFGNSGFGGGFGGGGFGGGGFGGGGFGGGDFGGGGFGGGGGFF